jgi:hypothetical protein
MDSDCDNLLVAELRRTDVPLFNRRDLSHRNSFPHNPNSMSGMVPVRCNRQLPPTNEQTELTKLEEGLMSTPTKLRTTARFIVTLCAVGLFIFTALSLVGETPASAQDQLDLNAIMPCGTPGFAGKQTADQCNAARNLFMQNCTSCHSFVPIVLLQKNEAGWDGTLAYHRPLLPQLSQADFDLVGQFLKDHFRPDRPVPNLPKTLIDNDAGFPF